MAVNPMQRKARNSFLLGIIITLIITGAVIVFLILKLKSLTDEQAKEAKLKVNVYTLNQDVKSGQVLTEDMFSMQTVNRTTVPSNATSVYEVIDTWFLQTKDGISVNTDAEGLYLEQSNSIAEVGKGDDGQNYKNIDGEMVKVSLSEEIIQDTYGAYIEDSTITKTRIHEELSTGEYYIYKLDDSSINTNARKTRVKEYIEFTNVPVVAKVDMNQNTVITPSLVVQSDERVTDDVRREEYNVVILPADLMTDDYIDIRLMMPSGQNFIVVSKKKVEIPTNADGTYVADAIWLNLREDEILAMSSAIVEAAGVSGAKLYATKYSEPGIQKKAIPTYTPNGSVTAQIQTDPNIVSVATSELNARYSENAKNLRNNYLQSVLNGLSDYSSNVEEGMDTSIQNSRSTRQQYLQSLTY